MKFSVNIDYDLLREAMASGTFDSPGEAVEAGLRLLVRDRIERQEPIRSLRGKLRWEGDLDNMRSD